MCRAGCHFCCLSNLAVLSFKLWRIQMYCGGRNPPVAAHLLSKNIARLLLSAATRFYSSSLGTTSQQGTPATPVSVLGSIEIWKLPVAEISERDIGQHLCCLIDLSIPGCKLGRAQAHWGGNDTPEEHSNHIKMEPDCFFIEFLTFILITGWSLPTGIFGYHHWHSPADRVSRHPW